MTFDLLIFAVAGASGLGLGAIYFYALHLAVYRLQGHEHPHRRLLSGAALRLGAALAVLFLAAQFGPEALVGLLPGFLVARTLMLRRTQRAVSAS